MHFQRRLVRASVVWYLNMSRTACIAVPAPASCPAPTCNEPAAFIASCLLIIITTFPDIFFDTFPSTINLNRGFLLREPHATKLSKDAQLLLFYIFVIHNFLTSSAIALRRSAVAVPKHDETIILLHPLASSPEGLKPPFVFIAAFFISSLPMSSCTIGCIFYIGSCIIACWAVSFGSGCFNSNKWSVSSVTGKIPLLMLLFHVFRDTLTFPLCIWSLNVFNIFTISFELSSDFSWSWISFLQDFKLLR